MTNPSPILSSAGTAAGAETLDLQRAQAVLLANQAEILTAPSAPSVQSDEPEAGLVSPTAGTAVTAVTALPLSNPVIIPQAISDSHSLHSGSDADVGEPISRPDCGLGNR